MHEAATSPHTSHFIHHTLHLIHAAPYSVVPDHLYHNPHIPLSLPPSPIGPCILALHWSGLVNHAMPCYAMPQYSLLWPVQASGVC